MLIKKWPSTTVLLQDPIVYTIELRRYLDTFIQMTTGMFDKGDPGVYTRTGLHPVIGGNTEFKVVTDTEELFGFTIDDIIDDKVPKGFRIVNARNKTLIGERYLHSSLFEKYPSQEMIAITTAYGILMDYIADEYYLHWSYDHRRIQDRLSTIHLLEEYKDREPDLFDWITALTEKIDGLLAGSEFNIIGVKQEGYIGKLEIYCDFRVYEWTVKKEEEKENDKED